jgi:peptidoglycan/xylan/chitin deacetylase (PgdA/CDA1 family)
MYHDVVERGRWDASGFPGADAALYKLDRAAFAEHLRAIAVSVAFAPALVTDLREDAGRTPWMITFDDGGESACIAADMLEELDWRGHFFVATDYIGTQTFLKPEQIRELRRRGHVFGSHSASHPLRMARCTRDQLLYEWRQSIAVLSDVLGEKVECASVPGGHYSRAVAEAAAEAGLRALFTSEPTAKCHKVAGTLVLGRYAVQRWTTPATATALARGDFAACARQRLLWDAKKLIKALGGEQYLKLRASLAARRHPAR